MMTYTEITQLPPELQTLSKKHTQDFFQSLTDKGISKLDHPQFLASSGCVWAMSSFVARNSIRFPEIINDLFLSGDILHTYVEGEFKEKLHNLFLLAHDKASVMKTVRLFRMRAMIRIAWRNLAGWCDFEEVSKELSELADICVSQTLRKIYQLDEAEDYIDNSPIYILALGKLGGNELNFSSDIDLIFINDESRIESAQALPYVRDLIDTLNTVTADGFVFRVDTRLRPYGDSGPLIMGCKALCDYYQKQGRPWERYALMRARLINQDDNISLTPFIRDFVYRTYVDYTTLSDIRHMKSLIEKQIATKQKAQDIKLGEGGIREVEFIIQTQMIIHGSSHLEIVNVNILAALETLTSHRFFDATITDNLKEAYVFLRDLENRLQMYADQQTHVLPTSAEIQLSVAAAMGVESWEALLKQLNEHCSYVHSQFELKIENRSISAEKEIDGKSTRKVWLGELQGEAAEDYLHSLGFSDGKKILDVIAKLKAEWRYSRLPPEAKSSVDRIIPALIKAASRVENSQQTFQRIADLLVVIMQRQIYLSLLIENPPAIKQLVLLFSISPWITSNVTRYPILLDELNREKTLYSPLNKKQLASELKKWFHNCDHYDLDWQVDRLREFKHVQELKVAAADVIGALPLMKVSDHLTFTAEALIQETYLRAQHSLLQDGSYKKQEKYISKFCIIAYGKLGGVELGYGSDLDLVFLYDGDEHQEYFIRLAQRIIHMLTIRTVNGVLYEVDARLRPSGSSGLLVSSISAFEQYQLEKAWVWEHQAIVRARVICGPHAMHKRFEKIRKKILSQERDPKVLQQEVMKMRNKMRDAVKPVKLPQYDLKQGLGGIIDIEFFVQYAVLCWGHEYPSLFKYTDNIRILEALQKEKLLKAGDAEFLDEAYQALRERVHYLSLQYQQNIVDINEVEKYIARVQEILKSLDLNKEE